MDALIEVAWVVGFIAFSMGGLFLVRRRVSGERLQEQHDVAAASFAVIGGLYGIVLAFVLVSSWERFETAREKAELEADALADLYRHAQGMPEPNRSALANSVIAYAHSVVEEEWSSMSDGEMNPHTQQLYEQVWRTVLAEPANDSKEAAIFQNTLSKLDDFSDARRDRMLYARVSMPGIVWGFLLVSGIVTIAFSYFFGSKYFAAQLIMTAALAGTIGAALFLIQEMQTPFSGSVQVPPYGFRHFLETVGSPSSAPRG